MEDIESLKSFFVINMHEVKMYLNILKLASFGRYNHDLLSTNCKIVNMIKLSYSPNNSCNYDHKNKWKTATACTFLEKVVMFTHKI